MTLVELAGGAGGKVRGNPDAHVEGLCPPDKTIRGHLCVLWGKSPSVDSTEGVYFACRAEHMPQGAEGIELEDPASAWPYFLKCFESVRVFCGIHHGAHISEMCTIGSGVHAGPGCVVMDGASVGSGTWMQANVYVGSNVTIGHDCVIAAGAVIQDGTVIGSRVVIHGNAVVGTEGFGFKRDAGGANEKLPQLGRVVLEDDVELGACVTIDRATVGETRIGQGSKIDNHVQVGHNCQIGPHCIIASMSGVSGSVTMGGYVTMGAQSGIKDHVEVGRGVVVAGRGGVTKDTPPGAIVSGFPAQDHRKELKYEASLRRVPDMTERIKAMEARIKELEERA